MKPEYEIDLGDSRTIEYTVKERAVFSDTETTTNIDTITITIQEPDGTDRVTDQSMSNYDTGKYFYKFDTDPSDPVGDYFVEVEATDSSNNSETDNFYIRVK